MCTNGIRPLRHNNIWGGRFSTSASSSPGNRTKSWLNLNRGGGRGLISRLTPLIVNSDMDSNHGMSDCRVRWHPLGHEEEKKSIYRIIIPVCTLSSCRLYSPINIRTETE